MEFSKKTEFLLKFFHVVFISPQEFLDKGDNSNLSTHSGPLLHFISFC